MSSCRRCPHNAVGAVVALALACMTPACSQDAPVIWLEAQEYVESAGTALLIDADTHDYGRMARTEASGGRFMRLATDGRLQLAPVMTAQEDEWVVWVRAFPLPGRLVTVAVNGQDVGTSAGDADTIALVWHRLGEVRLPAGEHTVELRAAEGNTGLAYVDVVALIADPQAVPLGASPEEVLVGAAAEEIREDFTAPTVEELAEGWLIDPPPGDDARVEMAPREEDGALHVHNGTGEAFRVTSRRVLDVKPGDQLTVRVRARKGRLLERITITVPGVGAVTPQLYRQFSDLEATWLVPPGVTAPVPVQIVGRGGGDTYISRVEAFRPDPPLDPHVTGRFLPSPNLRREGRLFELEAYVVNRDAISVDTDVDGDGKWSLCRLSREENEAYFSRGTVLKSDTVTEDRAGPEEGCPPLHLRVGPLRPGRYHAFLSVPGRALAYSGDGETWERIAGKEARDLGVVSISEEAPYYVFWLDDMYAEPGNPGPTYVDFIRFMPVEDPAYTMAPAGPPEPIQRGAVDRRAVALSVPNEAPTPRTEPVRSGVPVPQGELATAAQVRLLDGQGREVPCHVQATAVWPDGSVKWLLVDFEASVEGQSRAAYTLEYGNEVSRMAAPAGPEVVDEGGILTVDTGPVRVVFDRRRGGCFEVFTPHAPEPVLRLDDAEFLAADGRLWRASRDGEARVEVEEEGPLMVTVRIQGGLLDEAGNGPLLSDTRVHLFAGRAEALVEYGFFASAQEATVPLRQARLVFSGDWTGGQAVFGLEEGASGPVPVADGPTLVQTGDTFHGRGDSFPFRLADGRDATLAQGERAPGWLRLDAARPLLVAVPHFWQQFPKGLGCREDAVTVDLWPDVEGHEPFISHAGAGKSHRIGLSLEAGAVPERWGQPLMAVCDPEWYAASGAFEDLVPRRAGRYADYEAIVDAAFEAMLAERAGYGMENWGDVWQGGYVPGALTWSNQEWDLVNNWVIPFVRTGDMRFFRFAHEATRHYADVDCIHDHQNPALIGAAWVHAHTSLQGHQLGHPNFAHAGWVEGMLNVYHLTGDRRGLEASQGIADYIVRHAPATDSHREGGPPYNLVTQRSAGWPLTTLTLVYRTTWEPVYLQTARRIFDYAHRAMDPERGAWDAQTPHEAPYRGGCVFAYTLLRGLRLLADITGEEAPREDYVRAAGWMYGELWRPGHRYLYEQCPLHEPGTRVPFTLSEMGGHATSLSGDPLYAAIAHDALQEHSLGGESSWMVASGASAQWGNGILQQVPRMLHDWERTGLEVDSRVALGATRVNVRVPGARPAPIRFTLTNALEDALEDVEVTSLIRGDWRAEVAQAPDAVAPGAEAEIILRSQAPPPLRQYELQSDLAHLHVLVTARHGERRLAAWAYARLDIARPLEVEGPYSVALKPGASAALALLLRDSVDPEPDFEVVAETALPGVTLGPPQVQATGEGTAEVILHVHAAETARPASDAIHVTVRSGPRTTALEVPAEVGRFRALMIESDASEEWRYPFNVLAAYPGIAPEFMPARLAGEALPSSAEDLAARWDVVIIGDTNVGAAAFTEAQLRALAEFVQGGGGLMMVAGMQCFTPGGYADTPLAEVLPVDMADGQYVMGEVRVEVTEPDLRFYEGYEPQFPPFGARQVLAEKPGTRVPARFTDGLPFITLGHAGQGRSVALAGIWNHGSGRAFRQWRDYGRFVGRVVRWVADDLELD